MHGQLVEVIPDAVDHFLGSCIAASLAPETGFLLFQDRSALCQTQDCWTRSSTELMGSHIASEQPNHSEVNTPQILRFCDPVGQPVRRSSNIPDINRLYDAQLP